MSRRRRRHRVQRLTSTDEVFGKRNLREPLEFEHDGQDYHIPAGQMVGVLPGVTNIDPARVPDGPHEFDPDRHVNGPMPREGIFGRGAFGCVAGEFNKTLTATILDELLTRYDLKLLAQPQERQLRIPQIHPRDPLPIQLTPRQRLSVGGTAEATPQLPSTCPHLAYDSGHGDV